MMNNGAMYCMQTLVNAVFDGLMEKADSVSDSQASTQQDVDIHRAQLMTPPKMQLAAVKRELDLVRKNVRQSRKVVEDWQVVRSELSCIKKDNKTVRGQLASEQLVVVSEEIKTLRMSCAKPTDDGVTSGWGGIRER